MNSSSRWALFFIFCFLLRLPHALSPVPPSADAADYQRLAAGLRSGEGFVGPDGQPTAFRPPLYPTFLGLLGPQDLKLLTSVQAGLGALSCCLVVLLGRRLGLAERLAWLPGALLAFDPVHQALAAHLLSENLYQPMLLLALWWSLSPSGLVASTASGAIMGFALLTRSSAAPVLLLLAAWLGWSHPRSWRAPSVCLIAAGLIVSPWVARNWIQLGAPVLTTQAGITLYSSYRPPQGRILGVLVKDETVTEAAASGEVAANRTLTRAAMRLALERPKETLRLAILKVAFFWVPVDWEILKPPGWVSPVYLWALPLAGVAIAQDLRRYRLLLVLFAGLSGFSALVYGSPRLRLPYEPLLFIPAAAAAVRVPRPVLLGWAFLCAGAHWAGAAGKNALAKVANLWGLW